MQCYTTKRLTLLLMVLCTSAGGWTTIGPGIEYQEYQLPDPNNVFVARMDRSNPNCTIESSIGQGRLSGGTETVRNQATRYDDALNYWGQDWGQRNDVIVAINGDFYNTSTGVPTSGQIQAGWFAKAYGTSTFAWTLDRAAFISGSSLSTQRITYSTSGSTRWAQGVNRSRGSDELIIYTRQYDSDTNTDNSGVEVLVEMTRPNLILPLSDPARGFVKEIRQNQGSTPIPFDHIVLSATGSAATTLLDDVSAGCEIAVSLLDGTSSWEKTYASVGGGQVFLAAGSVMGGQVTLHPRTAIAFNDDYIFFVVVDGRSSQSIGMGMADLGHFCKDYLGAEYGINQDGGGSSTMVVNGVVKNDPSDGRERSVSNGMMMVALQPKLQSTTFETGDQIKVDSLTHALSGPGSQYPSLGTLTKNTQGIVLDHFLRGIYAKGDYWWKGNFGSTTGWVAQSDLTLEAQGNGPRITQHPSSANPCHSDNAIYNVSATGTGTLGYQWQVNGANVSDGTDYSGTNSATLTVYDVGDDDIASYRCVIADDNGSTTSYSAALTLKAETIFTQQPISQTVYPLTGQTGTTFNVTATGEGSLLYQWKKDGNPISDDSQYSGTHTATLTIDDLSATSAGSYRCQVTTVCGDLDSIDAILTVISADIDGDQDVDLDDFGDLQACLGTLEVQQTNPDCIETDLDADNRIDSDDLSLFTGCLSGADIPTAPGC